MRPQPLSLVLLGLVFVACSPDLPVEDSAIATSQAAVTTTSTSIPRAKLLPSAEKIPGQYIVVLNDTAASVQSVAEDHARATGGQLGRVYQHALRGYVLRAGESSVRRLLDDSRVKYVVEDGVARANAVQPDATWGLDRIDQRFLPRDTLYRYHATGAGVNAYIIDTGIRVTHVEFGGRASHGFSAIDDGFGADDCHGHGTHVAGTVGSSTYGVAKEVNLVAVRVLDCGGTGTWSGVIAGIDWVTANRVLPAVANMSLGGGANQAVDDAVTSSVASGVTYAVAAGNSAYDACEFSPARTPAALTVGASTNLDARAPFSNFGACMDLFAPGMDITSTWNSTDTATITISGTSMASPHVAGAAALFLGENPAATPADVEAALESNGTPGTISDPGTGSPNLLLYSAFIGNDGGDQVPPTAELTSPAAGANLSGTVEIQATASDDTGVLMVIFYADNSYIDVDHTAPYSTIWNTASGPNGSRTLKAVAIDASGNIGQSAEVPVTVDNPGYATFDPVLLAPACYNPGPFCDTGALVVGRGPIGPELNAPNTIYGSCWDGPYGSFHSDESLDRIRISTVDGSELASGKLVQVDVTVWAWADGSSDAMDLYHAPDANNPSWTYLTTIVPPAGGEQVLSFQFILPPGAPYQAIRGAFRYGGYPDICLSGGFDDHDDLAFATGTPQLPPAVGFLSSCYGLDCAFTDISTDEDSTLVSWSWSFGDGSTSTEQNPSHVYAAGGTYTVTLTVTDSQGLSNSSTEQLTVSGLPPVAAFNASCSGLFCSFTDQSTDEDSTIVSWSWSFGDGYSTTLPSPAHVYFAAGTYTVTLAVTDSQGLTSTTSRTIAVEIPNITLTATGSKSKGDRVVDLAWSGAASGSVDVYRNGLLLLTTPNDGAHQDQVDGRGTFNYRVCQAGTTLCSNVSSVTF